MQETRATLPELALIGGTRVALGAGLGLLLADRLFEDQRRAIGWTLLLIGAISTVPLAVEIRSRFRSAALRRESEPMRSGPQFEATERLRPASELARS